MYPSHTPEHICLLVTMVKESRGPHNMPPANREVDSLTYNPQADARPDSAEFNENTNPDMHPIGARGADNQPTYRDYQAEDLEAEVSDQTGRIPKSEWLHIARNRCELTIG